MATKLTAENIAEYDAWCVENGLDENENHERDFFLFKSGAAPTKSKKARLIDVYTMGDHPTEGLRLLKSVMVKASFRQRIALRQENKLIAEGCEGVRSHVPEYIES